MNTCKTALRILKSRKMYLVIYLGFIGIMMFAISWQIMRGSMTGGDEVFHPDTARVAVIDRDGDADGISSALRSYLALDGEMVDLADDSETLQQAVASNYVDLIAIVRNIWMVRQMTNRLSKPLSATLPEQAPFRSWKSTNSCH